MVTSNVCPSAFVSAVASTLPGSTFTSTPSNLPEELPISSRTASASTTPRIWTLSAEVSSTLCSRRRVIISTLSPVPLTVSSRTKSLPTRPCRMTPSTAPISPKTRRGLSVMEICTSSAAVCCFSASTMRSSTTVGRTNTAPAAISARMRMAVTAFHMVDPSLGELHTT